MSTRTAAVEQLLESGIVERLAEGDRDGALALMREHLGTAAPA
jgi:DNA-binding GntR family transcriptional regulator